MADISVQFLQRKGRAFGFPFTKSELEEYKKDVVGNALKFLTIRPFLCIQFVNYNTSNPSNVKHVSVDVLQL